MYNNINNENKKEKELECGKHKNGCKKDKKKAIERKGMKQYIDKDVGNKVKHGFKRYLVIVVVLLI